MLRQHWSDLIVGTLVDTVSLFQSLSSPAKSGILLGAQTLVSKDLSWNRIWILLDDSFSLTWLVDVTIPFLRRNML